MTMVWASIPGPQMVWASVPYSPVPEPIFAGISGGNPSTVHTNTIDGGNPSTIHTDIISGGNP